MKESIQILGIFLKVVIRVDKKDRDSKADLISVKG